MTVNRRKVRLPLIWNNWEAQMTKGNSRDLAFSNFYCIPRSAICYQILNFLLGYISRFSSVIFMTQYWAFPSWLFWKMTFWDLNLNFLKTTFSKNCALSFKLRQVRIFIQFASTENYGEYWNHERKFESQRAKTIYIECILRRFSQK